MILWLPWSTKHSIKAYGLNESTFQFKIKEIQWFMLGHGK